MIFSEQANGIDLVLGMPVRWGIGYGLPKHEAVPDSRAAVRAGAELDVVLELAAATVVAMAAVAGNDVCTAREVGAKVWEYPGVHHGTVAVSAIAQCAHLEGDLAKARELADEAVATLRGWHRMWALFIRAYIAADLGDIDQSRRDAHQALSIAVDIEAALGLPAILECLGQACGER